MGYGDSATTKLMMSRGQSRKDAPGQMPPSSARTSLRIGSWNVRTLYEAGKCKQASSEMHRNKLDILGISESHWTQFGQKRFQTGEEILFSGKDHREGVALILRKTAKKTLRGWEAQGSRIIMASLSTTNKRINMNIVQIYAPTNDEEEKKDNYNRLQAVIEGLPNKDLKIIMGDANAKVGEDNTGYEETMGKHGVGQMIENGERFANICSFNRLVIGGTIFPHKKIHKATWVPPDQRTENQIDHFGISRKFRRLLEDKRVLRGADIGSDHHLLLAILKLRLKIFYKNDGYRRPKYQVSLLQGGLNKKEEFKLSLKNKFQALEVNSRNVEDHWKHVKETIATCKEVLGDKERKHKEWINKESFDKILTRRIKKGGCK